MILNICNIIITIFCRRPKFQFEENVDVWGLGGEALRTLADKGPGGGPKWSKICGSPLWTAP